ncbi:MULTISPECIES: hypothetical protein [Kyrpidia]|uniref:hypothetical protein n=1 Tax=Kyrpidia TaxID=1129704 RepID=UPI0013000675|nr:MULTISPECIES: hypothetical protein [Kyrpidia]MCL6576054.1 hypothetical protein [Kyrpidia sp.]
MLLKWLIAGVIPFGVLVYTFNLSRWLWRRGLRSGAVGSLVVGVLGFVLSVLGAWRPWE